MSDSEKDSSEREPEIIVDSDWKEQVAKEKEAAEAGDPSGENPETQAAVTSDPAESSETSGPDADTPSEMPPPPPASLEMLVSMLFTQAMAALGQVPDPATGTATVNKSYAKHYIDTLDMLSQKTEGNLSDAESKMIDEVLHALRMTYVNTKAD